MPYTGLIYGLYNHSKVKFEREKQRHGVFTFEVDESGLEGVKFQLTSKGKFSVTYPRGADVEEIVRLVKPVLDEAAGRPVMLRPLLEIHALIGKEGVLKEHVLSIASGLWALIKPRHYSSLEDLSPKDEYREYALQHLESGYPEIFKLAKRAKGLREEASKMTENFWITLKEKFKEKGILLYDEYKDAAWLLLRTTASIVRKESFTDKNGCRCYAVRLGSHPLKSFRSESEAEEFEKQLKELEGELEGELKGKRKQLWDIENEETKCLDKFYNEVYKLALALKDGLVRLEGKCELHGWRGDEKEIEQVFSMLSLAKFY